MVSRTKWSHPKHSITVADWEPYSVMAVDSSEMVTKFIESYNDSGMVDERNLVTADLFCFECFGQNYKAFHWASSLLSEVPEWDVSEGGGFSPRVSSPRLHRVIIP
jgi:hypothetical protein